MNLSPRDAAILADDVEAAAFVDLYDAAPADLKSKLGIRVERIADATLLVAPGIPSSMFNRAIGLGLRQPAEVRSVEAIVDAYRRAGVKAWWLHWNPWSSPDNFPACAIEQGFTVPERRSWAKMLRSTQSPPARATDLSIAIARDSQAETTARIIATVFEMPPFMGEWIRALQGRSKWKLYAVADGTDIVGGGCLFVDARGGWLGMGAIAPTHRRRGGHSALMARRIADSAIEGVPYAITETGEPKGEEPNPSLENMRRNCFEQVASRLNYIGPT